VVANPSERLSKFENPLFRDVLGFDRSAHVNSINNVRRIAASEKTLTLAEPGIRRPEPGIRRPEPGIRRPEPGIRRPEPGIR
jgi:hypothetical protein